MRSFDSKLPYFDEYELACKGTGAIKMDMNFAVHFPLLRHLWGEPFTPNSVCRTPEHNSVINKGRGGHPNSLHLTENPKHPTCGTMAADVPWRGWNKEKKLSFARLAWSLGWAVGLHDGFCHVDRRVDVGLVQKVFLYGHWSGHFDPEDVKKAGD